MKNLLSSPIPYSVGLVVAYLLFFSPQPPAASRAVSPLGVVDACAGELEDHGSCKPMQNWDCIIGTVEKPNKCDASSCT
jgi:hypothetical protein